MALVIANIKLLLDQVGYTGTGPQRSLIAQPLGTLDQQLLQLPPLFFTQTWHPAGAPRFPERGLPLGTVLMYPAGHGLGDNVDLTRNLRLFLSAFP